MYSLITKLTLKKIKFLVGKFNNLLLCTSPKGLIIIGKAIRILNRINPIIYGPESESAIYIADSALLIFMTIQVKWRIVEVF